MSSITVYGIPGSPFLRTVEIVLKEKDVPYHLQVMAPGEQRTEEHLKRHPFGRIPVMQHDGLSVYETQAIIRYLDQIYIHPKLTPQSSIAQARMNQAIGIIECYFFPKAAAPIGFHRVIGPALLGITPDETVIAEALPMAEKSIAAFEGLLGDQIYLTGDHASLADIMLGAQLDIFSYSSEGAKLLEGRRLERWLERMKSRPSFVATEPPALLRSAALAA